MSVRFPDLQVLLPRSAETGRMQQITHQQQETYQQAAAGQTQLENERRQRQVPDSRETQGKVVSREERREDRGQGGRRKGGGTPGEEDGQEDHVGGRLDIKA